MLKENINQVRTVEEEAERDIEAARKESVSTLEKAAEKSQQLMADKIKQAEDKVARLILEAEVKGKDKTESILSEADRKKGILRDDSRSKTEEAITLVKDTVIHGN
ncbi:MAG: hypothetical protein ABIJ24_00805 [Nitrospinota bacterium]|nr:hypothetical protein [Nitrospinota bacterium]